MKTRLEVIREFDPWKSPLCTCPRKYVVHPYTGCSHFCLYCYATSYMGLRESSPKDKFISKLKGDALKIERNAIVELSTSSDPYPPIEQKLELTRRTLEILASHGFRVLITTKSNLVTRDIDILAKAPAAVMITITTLNEDIAKLVEPGAPSPRDRLQAIRILSENNIPVGVRIDPIIPFINDDPVEVKELVDAVFNAGALHIVTSTYKARWDSLKRLREKIPDVGQRINELYRSRGTLMHGYLYLPYSTRRKLLGPVIERSRYYGLTYATCREGFIEYHRAPSCDGSHLTDKTLLIRNKTFQGKS